MVIIIDDGGYYPGSYIPDMLLMLILGVSLIRTARIRV